MTGERKPLASYWGPRYWPVWLGMGLLRLICMLPHRLALAAGRVLGRIAHAVGGSRRAVVRRNIELCFPELSPDERDALAYEHFKALGMTVVEMGLGRWASDQHLLSITKLNGIEHVQNALDSGRGVILLSAHFTTLEIMGRVLSLNMPPFDAVFRRNRSEFMTELQRTGRERSAESTIEKRDVKKVVRSLRDNRAVWYAPDQSYNRKGAEVIPFFGTPAMHTTATSTLARLGNAVVIPFFPRRLKDSTYELTLLPAFENFPGDDPVADTKRYVELLEQHVRSCPEQYFWIHRKFKDLPDGYPDYYADLEALK
ncbi:MAG: lipid A biosynthesis lauroyl acyltransferase [Gammaproteobacteria bacterium]|nr:lipid A biosynthesis lauroyl acyltransferase [Gammaproteobacteria bacterium]MBT8110801.1 lipid A biosynthesis lauroyl acyltransferase [Gammaproteobacteria bacterium]NNL45500.1 lipid A biosynthesis lauroyl acyltransferase [Woeseiaceae bacterium]